MSTASDVPAPYQSKFFPRLPVPVRRGADQARLIRKIATAERRGYERGLEEAKRRFETEAFYFPTMRKIAEEVAEKYGLKSWKQLRSHRRNRPLVIAKQELWWRCREETAYSLPSIGRFFGFDHTTILAGARRHDERNPGNTRLLQSFPQSAEK